LAALTHPSPNFGARKDGALPDIIVVHYTAMQSAEAACRTLRNPETEVSAHYLIAESGEVMSLVAEESRAWHAGAGRWGDVVDVNSRSIGIELANDGVSPFAAPLMDSLEELLAGIMRRWAIAPERVIAHSDLAPGRKIDPGRRFDWQRLARGGLAVWPGPDAVQGQAAPDDFHDGFHADACAFGYSREITDAARLAAFRLRFRFGHDGPLDAVDAGMARDLARRFPVDRHGLTS
jgi:N-acetylmuramoyl-L-alanine amidase